MSEINYKLKCEHYEKLLGIDQYDPVKGAFIIYANMLNQQIEYLSEFKIKNHITNLEKDSIYKRAMEMVDGLPKIITSVNDLRSTLKLTKEDISQIQGDKAVFSKITSPESIANALGNSTGSKD